MTMPPLPVNVYIDNTSLVPQRLYYERDVKVYALAVLEAAAKVVDEFAADPDVTDGIADAIRAMKEEK